MLIFQSIYISHECVYSATVLKVYTHQKVLENGLYMSQHGAQWNKVLSNGLVGPLVIWSTSFSESGDSDPGLFKVHITDLFTGLGKFLHQFFVVRRDAAVKELEKLDLDKNRVVAPYKWLQPGLVPPLCFS